MKKLITLGLMILSLSILTGAKSNYNPQPSQAPLQVSQQVTPQNNESDIDQMIETIRKRREQRQQEAENNFFNQFANKFGYNPKEYDLNFLLSGENITVYGASYWAKFHVKPEEGLIQLGHTTATRDWWWGTTHWHDHQVTSVKFIVDSDACQVISDGVNCIFTGKDQISLQNFIANHEIIRHGIWEIKYIESNEERQVAFRVPKDELPKGTREGVKWQQIESSFCKVFPDGLDCQKPKDAS